MSETGTAASLAEADLRVLVMCLFHMTGDRKWLEPPYRPMRDVRLIADPDAGFDEAVSAEIRQAADDWLSLERRTPAVDDPGADAFGELISIFLGEQVPDEYIALIRQDMGFEPNDVDWPDGDASGESARRDHRRRRRVGSVPRREASSTRDRLSGVREER